MISVGIRLPEDVFPQPDEPIGKIPANTSDNPAMSLNGIDKDGVAHINRIVLNRTANVELLNVESPSRIWVRLQNHITETALTIREPFKLKKKEKFVEGDYVLAPCDERAFRRCRIVDAKQANLIKVFFIDDATYAWVAPDAIAELDEHYMFFPWQAIQVSMFGIYPAIRDVSEERQLWSEEACYELRRVLSEFPLLQVHVVLSSVIYNDYNAPLPVTIHGVVDLESPDRQHRSNVTITDLLLEAAPQSLCLVPNYDAAGHELFDTEEPDEVDRTMMVLEHHTAFPENWKSKSVEEELAADEAEDALFNPDAEHPDFDPRQNCVKMLTIEELIDKFSFPDAINGKRGHVMLAVEGKCTKSPYEWYARPIVKTWLNPEEEVSPHRPSDPLEQGGWRETDLTDWMIYGNDQLLSMAEQLDTYYSLPKNRKPLKSDEIKKMRDEGLEVFAVCAVNEEKALYTGEWQRVLILNCDDFAEVRFLDSGGRDMVLTSSLYRIHRQHCRFPPMCLQLSMHGIATRINRIRSDKKWNVKETANFKICLREDVPIFIDTAKLTNLIPPAQEDPRPYMRKHVMMVRDVTYIDESKSVLDRFVGAGHGCAELSESHPQPWRDYE